MSEIIHDINFKDIAFCIATLHQSVIHVRGMGNNAVMTVAESRANRRGKRRANRRRVNIDTGTYHPVSTSKNSSSSSSSSSSLVSSNGRLVLALDEVGLSSPRSFASTSFAHMALMWVILPSAPN
eukprot:scaffold132440_cov66-Attheya_sp.AAC.3